jgi:hypothetical protein
VYEDKYIIAYDRELGIEEFEDVIVRETERILNEG